MKGELLIVLFSVEAAFRRHPSLPVLVGECTIRIFFFHVDSRQGEQSVLAQQAGGMNKYPGEPLISFHEGIGQDQVHAQCIAVGSYFKRRSNACLGFISGWRQLARRSLKTCVVKSPDRSARSHRRFIEEQIIHHRKSEDSVFILKEFFNGVALKIKAVGTEGLLPFRGEEDRRIINEDRIAKLITGRPDESSSTLAINQHQTRVAFFDLYRDDLRSIAAQGAVKEACPIFMQQEVCRSIEKIHLNQIMEGAVYQTCNRPLAIFAEAGMKQALLVREPLALPVSESVEEQVAVPFRGEDKRVRACGVDPAGTEQGIFITERDRRSFPDRQGRYPLSRFILLQEGSLFRRRHDAHDSRIRPSGEKRASSFAFRIQEPEGRRHRSGPFLDRSFKKFLGGDSDDPFEDPVHTHEGEVDEGAVDLVERGKAVGSDQVFDHDVSRRIDSAGRRIDSAVSAFGQGPHRILIDRFLGKQIELQGVSPSALAVHRFGIRGDPFDPPSRHEGYGNHRHPRAEDAQDLIDAFSLGEVKVVGKLMDIDLSQPGAGLGSQKLVFVAGEVEDDRGGKRGVHPVGPGGAPGENHRHPLGCRVFQQRSELFEDLIGEGSDLPGRFGFLLFKDNPRMDRLDLLPRGGKEQGRGKKQHHEEKALHGADYTRSSNACTD